jgi:dTDP-4-dehydrorhamnose reductase
MRMKCENCARSTRLISRNRIPQYRPQEDHEPRAGTVTALCEAAPFRFGRSAGRCVITLVIGSDGTIGSALAARLAQQGHVVYGTTRRKASVSEHRLFLDLAGDVAAARLPPADIAFVCAGIVGFAACRVDIATAARVNVSGRLTLAERLVAAGTRVVLLSTSAVFDGRVPKSPAYRPPCPITVYGRLAAETEEAFGKFGAAVSILRLTKVLTSNASLFRGWIEKLARGGDVEAYVDHHFSPISIDDVLSALSVIMNDSSGGIFHVSGAADISYYEAACHLAMRMGRSGRSVIPRRAEDAGMLAEEIARFTSLDCSRLTALASWAPPRPYDVLDRVYGPQFEAARTSQIS